MPYHFEFDHEHRILLVISEGDLSDSDLLEGHDDTTKHVISLNPSAGISDLSGVTSFSVSGDGVRRAAERPSPYKDPMPRFLVAPHDHVFGLSRMYQIVGCETREALQVVRSREEAFAALGVQNPRFERVP
jgi:hypothetical protein